MLLRPRLEDRPAESLIGAYQTAGPLVAALAHPFYTSSDQALCSLAKTMKTVNTIEALRQWGPLSTLDVRCLKGMVPNLPTGVLVTSDKRLGDRVRSMGWQVKTSRDFLWECVQRVKDRDVLQGADSLLDGASLEGRLEDYIDSTHHATVVDVKMT